MSKSLQSLMLGNKYVDIAVIMKMKHRLSLNGLHNLAHDLMFADFDGKKKDSHLRQMAVKWVKEGRYAE